MSDTLTPREERIEVLLTWYIDALEGWRDAGHGSDELGLKLMSRAWNHPSYKELHKCLIQLRDEQNKTYWHVSQKFQAHRRTVLACPHHGCGATSEVAARHFDENGNVRLKHRHDGPVFFVRKTVAVVNAAVNEGVVLEGVRWLAKRFAGEPFIPNELMGREKAA